jgi:hypothetical protein
MIKGLVGETGYERSRATGCSNTGNTDHVESGNIVTNPVMSDGLGA